MGSTIPEWITLNKNMEVNEYQKQALGTAIYGAGYAINYPILGLVGEAGELANKYKKVLRDEDGILTDDKKKALIDELGDVLWYCAALANDLDTTLEDVMVINLTKLANRRAANSISGSGDNR